MIEIFKDKTTLLATVIVTVLLASLLFVFAGVAEAQIFEECDNAAAANSEFCKTIGTDPGSEDKLFGPDSLLNRVTETIIFIAGSISVLMIVIGGLRYILSNGDPQGISNAKNTIIYAVVGLVIALSAEAILLLVLQRL
jgi:hypothetical protein